jgi:Uma2 family endonuclease
MNLDPHHPPATAEEVFYPASDGEPMAETEVHLLLMVSLIVSLRNYFAGRRVYVIGNMFLYYEEGNPKARKAPDIMIIKGVDPTVRRRSFHMWREKAGPRVTFELTSEGTAGEDLGEKKLLYEQLQVREYFLYDPLDEYLSRQLMGFQLFRSKYRPMRPGSDGSLISKELGLRLVPAGPLLTLVDLRTGQRLPTPEEDHQLAVQLRQDLDLAQRHLESVEKQLRKAHDQALRAEELIRREQSRARQAAKRARQTEEQWRRERERAKALAEELAKIRSGQKPGP